MSPLSQSFLSVNTGWQLWGFHYFGQCWNLSLAVNYMRGTLWAKSTTWWKWFFTFCINRYILSINLRIFFSGKFYKNPRPIYFLSLLSLLLLLEAGLLILFNFSMVVTTYLVILASLVPQGSRQFRLDLSLTNFLRFWSRIKALRFCIDRWWILLLSLSSIS